MNDAMNDATLESTDAETERIKAEIGRMVAEMERLHAQIKRDQERVEVYKRETDATLARARADLASIQTARRDYVATSF